MAETYKRELVRQWLELLGATFVDTINQAPPADMATPWCTVVFEHESSTPDTYGRSILEKGLIDIIFAGAPGDGNSALLATVESDVATLMAQSDPQGRLTLEFAHAPIEATNGSADHTYQVAVGIEYTYSYTP